MPHQRRRSGYGSGNTSMTDVRKSVTVTDLSKQRRPGLSRKHTPQKLGRSHRERERESQRDSWDDERESFPQYCMTCEKQFMPYDDKYLYCSESCRKIDQNSSSSHHSVFSSSYSNYNTSPDVPFSSASEPRDIIPRAAPSRPSSMHFQGNNGSSSPPATPGTTTTYHHSSALSALRSLNARPPSPASPTGSSGAGIWPFSTRSAATSPSTSYSRPSGFFSSTYDTGYGAGGYGYEAGGLDSRPLPSRHPGGYARPKSIELVTPALGR